MTPTPDTTPAAVDAMEKALPCPFCGATPHRGPGKVEHCQLHGEPFQRFSVWCPRGHAKITGRNESAAREEWNMRAPSAAEAAAMLREVARERDARTIGEEVAFNQRNMALDALKAAEAEAAALREALRKAHDALAPAVGEVEIVSPIAKPIYRAFGILIDALKETSDGL